MIKPAPIVIFAYKRPEHTRKVLEALQDNELFAESELIIFSDGPGKNETEEGLLAIKNTREIINKFSKSNKEVIESKMHKGLASSIISGIDSVLQKHDRIIVLEDDIVTGKGFLRYMNESLSLFENDNKIMHVSAYMPRLKGNLPELAFIKQMQCWGWGTWKRAWKLFNPSARDLLSKFSRRDKFLFDYNGSYNFYRMLKHNAIGLKDSWAIRWYASIFLNNGLCFNPTKSLTINIGHDGSGTHSYRTLTYDVVPVDYVKPERIILEEDPTVRKALTRFFWKLKFAELPNYIRSLVHNN